MNRKQMLLSVYNGLTRIETKGESTLILADCIRALADIVQGMPDGEEIPEESAEESENKPEQSRQ